MAAIHSDSDNTDTRSSGIPSFDYTFSGVKTVQQIIDDLAISGEGTVIALTCGELPVWGTGKDATTQLKKAIKDAYAEFNQPREMKLKPSKNGKGYIVLALTTVRTVAFLYTPGNVIQDDDEDQ